MSGREPSWEELENYLRAKGWTIEWKNPRSGSFSPPFPGQRVYINTDDGILVAIAHIAAREGRAPGDVKRDIIDGIPAEPEPTPEKTFTLSELEEYAYKRYIEGVRVSNRALAQAPDFPDLDTAHALATELRGVVRMLAWLKAGDRDSDMYWARGRMRMDVIFKGLSERYRREHPN